MIKIGGEVWCCIYCTSSFCNLTFKGISTYQGEITMKIAEKKKIVAALIILSMFIILIVIVNEEYRKIIRVFVGENEEWHVQVTFQGETGEKMAYRVKCQVEYIGTNHYVNVPLDINVHTWPKASQRIGPFIWNSDEKHYFEMTTQNEIPITQDSMAYFNKIEKIEIPVEIQVDQKKMEFKLIEK